jgi:hypothetical protein
VGIDQGPEVFTVSMSFRKNVLRVGSGRELARGYLDDLLIISFGIADVSSHFVEVGVEEVLTGHVLCQDLVSRV